MQTIPICKLESESLSACRRYLRSESRAGDSEAQAVRVCPAGPRRAAAGIMIMMSESESQALCALPFSMTKDSCCQVHADVIMLTSCSHLATTEQDVLKKCREAFEQFDMDGSGTIEPWELKVTPRLALAAHEQVYLDAPGRSDRACDSRAGNSPSDGPNANG